MTNEIEKEFFDAFGIEPYDRYFKCSKQLERECKKICECCELSEEVRYYPEITDRILLELICIETQVNKAHNIYSDVENLKEHILVGLRPFTEKCYNQVRELFGEKE